MLIRLRSFFSATVVVVAILCFSARPFAAAKFVRLAEASVVASGISVSSGSFSAAVTAGNLIVVRVFYNSASRTVAGVTDTKNNSYAKAVGPTTGAGTMAAWRQEIWYARNVAGGTGLSVTATFDATFNAEKSISAHEYSGLDTVAPFDVAAAQTSSASNSSSGSATTSGAAEMIFGAALFSGCGSAGSGFVARSSSGCNVTEDKNVTTAGSFAAIFTNSAQSVIAQMATFRAAGQTGDTTPPSVPTGLTATAASQSSINLSWIAATDNIGVAGYQVFRGGAQIASATGTTYSDTGLTPSTSYIYSVKAVDGAGNASGPSANVSATTLSLDTTPPTVPAGVTATSVSQSQINVSWQPSTDNIGDVSYRVYRGTTRIATTTATSYSDNGLAPFTTYSYTIIAVDSAGNASAPSSSASAATAASGPTITYSTTFPQTENPLSEGGNWVNGGTLGLAWTNVTTTPGLAIGRESGVSGYDDATAVLTGSSWGSDQTAEATVYSVNQDDSIFEEVELRLRTSISPNSITGYEVNFAARSSANAYTQIVRWNGPLSSFTVLDARGGAQYGIKTGDVVKATVVGNVITSYINGVAVLQVTDNTYTNGTPGIGFYLQNGTGVNGDYGFSTFTATANMLPDTQKPSVPTGLVGTPASPSQIDLSWVAATDNVRVAGYQVFRDSSLITTTTGNILSDTGLAAARSYTYSVKAIDGAGNVSDASTSVTVTTLTPPDTTPPATPTGLSATAISSSQMNVSWVASIDNVGVAGYRVYRGGTQVGSVTSGTSFVDSGLTPSTTYTYLVSAYDAANNVSPGSSVFGTTAAVATTTGTVHAVTCSQTDVQNAISSAPDGYTVIVPPGVCTWVIPVPDAPAISINRRAITLQGAGIDQTMISAPAGTTPAEVAIQVDEVTGADVRITGFTFSGATNSGVEMVRVNGTSKSFRLDHNKFSATGLAIGVHVAGATYGVLDHNTFVNARAVIEDDGDASWQRTLGLGDPNAVYVEDNTFTFSVAGPAISAFSGARYVYRYNTTNAAVENEGGCYTGTRGTRRVEIYGNTLSATGAGGIFPPVPIALRSGTGVVYDNVVSGPFGTPIILVEDLRSDLNACVGIWAAHPACDGGSPYDGNADGNSGYLCRDQIGASTDSGLSSPQSAEPMYAWNNSSSSTGGPVDVVPVGGPGTILHIQENRDFFNVAPQGYTPYLYPHPLVGQPPPDTQPPAVAITAPSAQANVSGAVTLSGVASDNVAVATVTFLLDGSTVGSALTSAPYSMVWDTSTAAPGPHTLAAAATDVAGNAAVSAAVTVTVLDTTAPVLTAVANAGTSATGTTITWSTNEPSDSQVVFVNGPCPNGSACIGGVNPQLVTSHSVVVGGLAPSTTYAYQVNSKDAAGNVTTSPVQSFVTLMDTTPPTASMSQPTDGAVVSGASTIVLATASDDVGIVGVQITLDGNNLGPETITAPYSTTWNTTQAVNGVHVLTAIARDATGNVTTAASVTVTVSNNLTPPTITSLNQATFSEGMTGTFTITATGSPLPSVAETGALPTGVAFVNNGNGTATLSGTPAVGTGGTYSLTITASNGVGAAANQTLLLTVNRQPTITSAGGVAFIVGTPGSFTVTTIGTPPPSLTRTGALPSGLSFVSNGNGTGTLSGTPAAGSGGTYPLILTATNGVGAPATQNFTLNVNQAPAITSASSTIFTVGAAGSFTVTTTGTPTPSLTETGVLPSGVTFTTNGNGTATLSGTPASGSAGTYPLTIVAGNGISPAASQSFTLTVNAGGGTPTFAYISGSVTGAINSGSGSSTTLSVPLHLTPGAGNLLICAATWQSTTATASMSDPNNGRWLAVGAAKQGTATLSAYRGQSFLVPATVNAATTVTLTISSSVVFRAFECAEYSRTGAIGALDGTPQYSTARASGGVATVSGPTTSGPSELIFAACLAVDSTCSVGTGYTARNDANAYDVATGRFGTSFVGKTGQMIQDKVSVPAGAQSATFKTSKSTDNVILGLLAVK